MKKITFAVALMTLLIFALNNNAKAGSYGLLTITGIITNETHFVVLGSAYDNGYQTEECLKTDWWWPAGTQYAMWLPLAGNETKYEDFRLAYILGKKMWVGTSVEYLAVASGIDCKLGDQNTTGNY
ncbi:hypothetical protein ACFL08_05590 [Patescibacteria group bacterium]